MVSFPKEIIIMSKKQPFALPDAVTKFTASVREMSSRKDNEDFKAITDEKYKRAERFICESLIKSFEERYPLKNEISQN
jgi:hypothetical protein